MVPVALKGLEIIGGGGVITTKFSVCEPVPPKLIALMIVANVPLSVGVPKIKPVDTSHVRPAGRPRVLKLVGLFSAWIW